MGWVMAGGQATVQDPGSSPPPHQGQGWGGVQAPFTARRARREGVPTLTGRTGKSQKSDKMTPTHRNRDWGTDIQSEEKTKLLT